MKKVAMYVVAGAAVLLTFKALTSNKEEVQTVQKKSAVAKKTAPEKRRAAPAKQASQPRASSTLAAKTHVEKNQPDILQAFKTSSNTMAFSIQTENVGCSLGDFNMMSADASMRGTKKVLVTVEALNGKNDRPLLSEQVALTDFVKGREWVVPLSSKLKNAPLGVFICSDKAGTKRCMGKSVKDINELWATFQKAESRKGSYPKDDHVLMFQYLHRQNEGVSFLPADALHHFGGDTVKSTLLALNGKGAESQRVTREVYRYLNVLKPMPGRLSRDSISFPLPNATCR